MHYAPEHALIGDAEYSYTIGVLAHSIVELIKPDEEIIGRYWGFTDDGFGAVDGWQWQDLLPPEFEDGYLKTVSTGTDGYISRDDLVVDGSQYQTVETALAVEGGGSMHLSYQIQGGPTWYDAPAVSLTADGQVHVYSFDLQNSAPWTSGTVTAIRLAPSDASDVCCWIDYLWINP
jgi:hypothetical protein